MEELIKDIKILEAEISQKTQKLKEEYIKLLIEKKEKEGAKASLEYFAKNTPDILNKQFCESWIQHDPIAEYANENGDFDRTSIIEYSDIINNFLWVFNGSSTTEKNEMIEEFGIDVDSLRVKLDSLLSEKTKEEIFFDELFNILIATIKKNFSYKFDW